MIEAALIEKIFRRYGLAEQYRAQEPALLWPKVVGARLAQMTEPLYVQKNVLFVAVVNHVFQHEFTLMREEFRRKLNKVLGAERVREVRFVVKSKPQAEPSCSRSRVTPQEEREIEQLLAGIEDAELHRVLRELMKTAKQRERARCEGGWMPCPRCRVLCAGNFCPLCAEEIL